MNTIKLANGKTIMDCSRVKGRNYLKREGWVEYGNSGKFFTNGNQIAHYNPVTKGWIIEGMAA